MALTKEQTVLGFTTQAYAKVSLFSFSDYYVNGVKYYRLEPQLTLYTNNTKENNYSSVGGVQFEGLGINDGTITKCYELIKTMPEFSDWTDC